MFTKEHWYQLLKTVLTHNWSHKFVSSNLLDRLALLYIISCWSKDILWLLWERNNDFITHLKIRWRLSLDLIGFLFASKFYLYVWVCSWKLSLCCLQLLNPYIFKWSREFLMANGITLHHYQSVVNWQAHFNKKFNNLNKVQSNYCWIIEFNSELKFNMFVYAFNLFPSNCFLSTFNNPLST